MPTEQRGPTRRYGRDTPEFARVVNLSDAVFAIAMTLLVLTLEVPDVVGGRLAEPLVDLVPQLLTVVLAFVLVANLWWQHHRLFSELASLEPGVMIINFVTLGLVALVPFPTGLVGRAPSTSTAVVPFVGVFLLLLATYLALAVRAQRQAAWIDPMPPEVYRWVVAGYLVVGSMMVVALVVALRWPVAGLAIIAVASAPERVLARRAPPLYRRWA